MSGRTHQAERRSTPSAQIVNRRKRSTHRAARMICDVREPRRVRVKVLTLIQARDHRG